jgi:hypothetical protein
MGERFYRVEVPEGQHLGQAQGSDDAHRGLLFDSDNNLVGHATLHEVDPDDEWSYDGDPWGRSPWEQEGGDYELSEEDAEALVALAILLGLAVVKAAPHVRRWLIEHLGPRIRAGRAKVKAAWARLTGRDRPVLRAPSVELVESYKELRTTMTSEEARKRFVDALLAQRYAEEQLRLLAEAKIVDGPAVTPAVVGAVLEELLERNPGVIEQQSLAKLRAMLASPTPALPASLVPPSIQAVISA